jgi:hypothetical protein
LNTAAIVAMVLLWQAVEVKLHGSFTYIRLHAFVLFAYFAKGLVRGWMIPVACVLAGD